MSASTDPSSTAGTLRAVESFSPQYLNAIGQAVSPQQLLMAQHDYLRSLMREVLSLTERGAAHNAVVGARDSLTRLATVLPVHQALEDSLLRRGVGGDPARGMAIDQFERDMVPLLSEFESLCRRFPTPSSILACANDEFHQQASGLFSRLIDRFRREERDLFASLEMAARGLVRAE